MGDGFLKESVNCQQSVQVVVEECVEWSKAIGIKVV